MYATDPADLFIAYTLACEVLYTRAYGSLTYSDAIAYAPGRETSLTDAPEAPLPALGTPEWIAGAGEVLDEIYAQAPAPEFSDATAAPAALSYTLTLAPEFSEPVAVIAPHVSRRLREVPARQAAPAHAPRRWPLPRLLPLAAAHAIHAPPAPTVPTRRAA